MAAPSSCWLRSGLLLPAFVVAVACFPNPAHSGAGLDTGPVRCPRPRLTRCRAVGGSLPTLLLWLAETATAARVAGRTSVLGGHRTPRCRLHQRAAGNDVAAAAAALLLLL